MPEKASDNVSWRQVGRKVFAALCGMRFSLVLLGLILAACTAGSVIPQNAGQAALAAQFGEGPTRLFALLGLDRVFTCWWFAVLAALLCLNLFLCSVRRLPQVWRQWRGGFTAAARLQRQDAAFTLPAAEPGTGMGRAALQAWAGARPLTAAAGPDGKSYLYCVKNRFGVWGSWLCHLGMLLLILSFAAGQLLHKEYVVYGIPGSTQPVGDTGYMLTIDDFTIDLRDDDTVEQYTAALTVTAPGGAVTAGTASVNHPLAAFGYELYQDSTGWANYVDITCRGELIGQDLLCTGEYTAPATLPDLVLLLNAFYPDFVMTGTGPATASPDLENPHALYSLFYQNQMLAMDVTAMGAPITVDDYAFTLHDPVPYTLIVIRRDPTAWLVGISALVLLAGILLAFYFRPQEVWCEADGDTLYARAAKAPALLRTELLAALHKARAAAPEDKE